MLQDLLQYSDTGLYLLQLALAIVFLVHGLPKVFKSKDMAKGMGMPVVVPLLIGAGEVLASIGFILGRYVQESALILVVIMFGAMVMKVGKWKAPFTSMQKLGWEFDFILFFAALAILLSGGSIAGL